MKVDVESAQPALAIPNQLFPIGPAEKQPQTIELEKLATRLYDPKWTITFDFTHFKGLVVIVRNGDIIENYPLFDLWGANGFHLQHLILQDPVFINGYLQRMKVKYQADPDAATLEDKSRTPLLEHPAFKYAMLDYSDLAFRWGINELLRGNDRALIDKLISVEMRHSADLVLRPGFMLTYHPEWRLWCADSQLKVHEIKISDIPGLKDELERIKEKKSISYTSEKSRIKRILVSHIALISSEAAEKFRQIITDMIGTILAASHALRDYHTYQPTELEAKPKSVDKYRILKWDQKKFPSAWNQASFCLQDPAFMSTSAEKIAFEALMLTEEEEGALVCLSDTYDRSIKNFSAHSYEDEHLLEPGTRIIMKKMDKFGPWHIFQGTVYATFEDFPSIDQSRVELYMLYLFERFYKDSPFKDLEISARDAQIIMDGYIIYKPNHNMVNAVRQMELGRQILLFLTDFSLADSDEQKFYQGLSADKQGSIHTEMSLLLMTLSVGRESEVSHGDDPEIYLQYRKKSVKRFLQFFTEQFPEEKDSADAFVKFFRPISSDSDEILKARFAIYQNILLNLGNPDYISKSQGLESYMHQILNTAHMLDHLRCIPRRIVLQNIAVCLKTALSEEGVKKIPILADYSLACIDATGDRIIEAGIGYRPCFAEYSLNPVACQRKLRQVPTPIFADWPEDQKTHYQIRRQAAGKLIDFYRNYGKEQLLLASLPVELLDSKISADSLINVMDKMPDGESIINYLLALKKANKLFIFYDKGAINPKFLELVSSLGPADKSTIARLVAVELIQNAKDFEVLSTLLHTHGQFFLFLQELGSQRLSQIIKENDLFVNWMVKLEDGYFKAFLAGYGQPHVIHQLNVCLEDKQSLSQIKRMGLHKPAKLSALLDSLKGGDPAVIGQVIANLFKIIFSSISPSQFLSSFNSSQAFVFLKSLQDLNALDLFLNKQNVKEYLLLKSTIIQMLGSINRYEMKQWLLLMGPYAITSPADLLALSSQGVFSEPGGYDSIVGLLEDKQLQAVAKDGKDFVQTLKGLREIHWTHARAITREYVKRIGAEAFKEFIAANKDIILSSLEKRDYRILDEFLPPDFVDQLFPEAQRLADKCQSVRVFSQKPQSVAKASSQTCVCVIF